MKKIIIALLTLTMLFAALVPVSAAEATFKAYDAAADGELIYTFNFNGDEHFAPKGYARAESNYQYIASEDGSSLTVKATETCAESGATSYWGGMIDGLEAGKKFAYTFIYKVKANGTTGVNNKLGVGAWFDNKQMMQTINNYGCHNAAAPEGAEAYEFSTCLQKGSSKYGDYRNWSSVGEYDTDADGFVTFMITYDGPNQQASVYMLAKGATDINSHESWLKVQTTKMVLNTVADGIGFATYSHYSAVDTTVKDVKLYKGILAKAPETTEKVDTKAPETVADTTAPETDPVAAEGGCGSSVSMAGMALVVTLGACAVVTTKKRRAR